MAVSQLEDYQRQLQTTANPKVRKALQNQIAMLQGNPSLPAGAVQAATRTPVGAPAEPRTTSNLPPAAIHAATNQSKPIGAPTPSQITKSGSGYSGTLSKADMATYLALPDSQKAAYIQGLAGPPTPTKPVTPPPTYGGYTYGSDPAKDKALETDLKLYETDPAAKQAEIQRTLAVIQQRRAQGLDTSEQEHHLKVTLKYDPSISTTADQPPMPTTPAPVGPPPGAFGGAYLPPMSPDDIQKQAEAAVAKKLEAARLAADQSLRTAETNAGQYTQTINDQLAQALKNLQTGATQAQQGVQTSFDRANAVENDSRTLQDFAFKNSNNPFSGRTDYAKGLIGRERETTDRQQAADLANQIGNINQNLSNQTGSVTQDAQTQLTQIQQDLANTRATINEKYAALATAAPEDIDSLVRSIQNDERQYALQLQNLQLNAAQVTGTYNGTPTLAAQNQAFNQGLQEGALTGVYNGKPTLDAQNQQFNQDMQTKQFDFQKATQAWNQAFQDKQFDYQKAQDLWNQQFKTKDFEQSVKQAAAQLGFNYAQMNQSQKQFATEQAYREKAFKADQEQRAADNAYREEQANQKTAVNMDEEKRGLVDGLRSGQLTPASAYQQIDDDVKLGFYTQGQAAELKSAIEKITPTLNSEPIVLTPQQQDALPSSTQLDELYRQQGQGKPEMDWKRWYVSPYGRLGGVDFNTWARLYGPVIGAPAG